MRVEVWFCCLLFAAFIAPTALGQTRSKADYTGTWVLDEKRSKDPFGSKKKTPIEPNQKHSKLLIIEHMDPSLIIMEIDQVESFDESGKPLKKDQFVLSRRTYYTDSRGEQNTYSDNHTYSSLTKWTGKGIFVKKTLDEKKRWYSGITFGLSKDGKELTVGEMAVEMEYNPVSPRDTFFPLPIGGIKVYRKSD